MVRRVPATRSASFPRDHSFDLLVDAGLGFDAFHSATQRRCKLILDLSRKRNFIRRQGRHTLDVNTRLGNLSAYYTFDQYAMDNPYPTGQGGANVPGFNALSDGRAQLVSRSLPRPMAQTRSMKRTSATCDLPTSSATGGRGGRHSLHKDL